MAPISGAPRTSMARIASAAASQLVSRATTNSCGSRLWSITPTDQPSGSSQMVRMCLPSTFMVSFSQSQHPPRHRIELFQQLGIARLRRGDQGAVERAVRADRAQLMLARELLGQARNQFSPSRHWNSIPG